MTPVSLHFQHSEGGFIFNTVTYALVVRKRPSEFDASGAFPRMGSYLIHRALSLDGALFLKESSCGSSFPFLVVACLVPSERRTPRPRFLRRAPVLRDSMRVASTAFRYGTTQIPPCFALGSVRMDTTRAASTAWHSVRTRLPRFRKVGPAQAAITPQGPTASSRSASNQICRYRRSGSQARSCINSSRVRR